MAEYILEILRSQLMVVFSWGFHKPQRLPTILVCRLWSKASNIKERLELCITKEPIYSM